MSKKRLELSIKKLWILYLDNALAHSAFAIKESSDDKCTPVLEHPLLPEPFGD
jgi:hypothetical protein